jgi:uncharacterized protein YdbL (DUF1318 family)
MRLAALFAAIALAGLGASAAQAQSDLASARRAGIVGERFDGYLGFARTPSEAVRKQAGAVNIKRRALYTGLATRRGVTRQVAEIAAGCELLSRVAVGELYMLHDGIWRRRDPGEGAPSPDHCPD